MTADADFALVPPRVRLSGPSDLATCVPYLLGFVPQASLVSVSLDAAREVVVVARIDLPGGSDTAQWAAAIGDHLGSATVRAGGVASVLVAYPPAPPPDRVEQGSHWRQLARRLEAAFDDHGVEMLDALLVAEGRWWSLTCDGLACCPLEGTALPAPGSTVAEAQAVLAGLTVLPSRSAVGAVLDPAPRVERQQVEELMAAVRLSGLGAVLEVERLLVHCRDPAPGPPTATAAMHVDGVALAGTVLAGTVLAGTGLTPSDVARALVAVDEVLVRDAVSHCPTPADATASIVLWTAAVRLAPQAALPTAAVLLAAAAYQVGNGLLARFALDAVLDVDPRHVLGSDLARALQSGVPPAEVAAVCLAGSAEARARIERVP